MASYDRWTSTVSTPHAYMQVSTLTKATTTDAHRMGNVAGGIAADTRAGFAARACS